MNPLKFSSPTLELPSIRIATSRFDDSGSAWSTDCLFRLLDGQDFPIILVFPFGSMYLFSQPCVNLQEVRFKNNV